MSRTGMIVPFFSFRVIPLGLFFLIFPKHLCTHRNSVIIWDIFKILYKNVYQVMAICRVQSWLFSLSLFQSCVPLIVFSCLFCVIYIIVHSITDSLS